MRRARIPPGEASEARQYHKVPAWRSLIKVRWKQPSSLHSSLSGEGPSKKEYLDSKAREHSLLCLHRIINLRRREGDRSGGGGSAMLRKISTFLNVSKYTRVTPTVKILYFWIFTAISLYPQSLDKNGQRQQNLTKYIKPLGTVRPLY